LANACERFGIGATSFSAAALAQLGAHAWPGNVRELRNVVERAALLAPSGVIDVAQLDLDAERTTAVTAPAPTAAEAAALPAPTLSPSVSATTNPAVTERERVLNALAACGGNQSRAAKFLGVSRRTLVRQIARLGLPRPRHTRG
jgi:DNA-binding NtrC family response regulator